ncbi:hypothetical protein [Methylosinus sp. PW1]|uniref:hypothetical protein n=1 Tax=Methylosinus sp. PW1 TaxID=107636 RepID=UPI00056573C3|nr:hypothetical protein [Methylosinus sp. PW1]
MDALQEPKGWFLYRAEHQHTSISYAGEIHTPLPHYDGPWFVQFQWMDGGGRLRSGRGKSLVEAWMNACKKVEEQPLPYGPKV